MRSCLVLPATLLLAATAFGAETILYDNFEDGDADGWLAPGEYSTLVFAQNGNASLRLVGEGAALRQVATQDIARVRIGASFTAMNLEFGEVCLAEATFDKGRSWFKVLRVGDGQDDGVTQHAGAVTLEVPSGTQEIGFRAYVAGNSPAGICWLDNVSMRGEPAADAAVQPANARQLGRTFLLGAAALAAPVRMREFSMPQTAAAPKRSFAGSLRLVEPDRSGAFRIRVDTRGRVAKIGEPVRHLPEFDFQFAQRGSDLLPLQRGVQRRKHPYWEIILQPGRAWDEMDDGPWTRVAVPFALQERSANCTHNGVLTWLFNDAGDVSRVAYQISSETCGYFKFDMWGVLAAEYRQQDLGVESAAHFERFDAHREARLPVRRLRQLAADFPGIDPLGFGVDDGIHPDDISVLGMVVDGVHYRSDCHTRYGDYPFCDTLALPSYSTAKSIFAGIATMRLERQYPGTVEMTIASLVEACDAKKWRDVTIEDALDMATGNFRSPAPNVDENSIPHQRFVFQDKHRAKLEFACDYFRRKAVPGSRFVYHTSDSYLVGAALGEFVARQGAGADLYQAALLQPIWEPLQLSPLLDDTKRSYDDHAQPFTGYGLTYDADDIVRIAAWLNAEARRPGKQAMLDSKMLKAALQRVAEDRGLEAGSARLRYNNGFWAYDAGASLGCRQAVWVPFMSGYAGITVAMFPNDVIYYYFADSSVSRWQSAIEAAHAIRPLC